MKMKGQPALTGLIRLMKARNGTRPGRTFDAIWVYRTQASRDRNSDSGFAVDHTGLVFVSGRHRLVPTPRLLRLVRAPVEDVTKGVLKTLEDVSLGAEPSFTSLKRLPFGGQGALLKAFETVTTGPFRPLNRRNAWVDPIVLPRRPR